MPREINEQRLDTAHIDWTTRYFLRRLAIARKKPNAAPYSEALFEVTLIAVVMPCMAAFSCLLASSLVWGPSLTATSSKSSLKALALVVGLLALVAGGIQFARRFGKYRDDPYTASAFDSERDRRVVFWQKFFIVITCILVIPLLALGVTAWILS